MDDEFGGAVLLCIVFLVGYFIYAPWSCHSRWDESKLQASWGPVKGCLVKLPDGRWLPEDRLREIDIKKDAP